jgi:dienelactone hydrolase
MVVAILEQHTDDAVAALQYLRAQPFVDKSRMAVAGCSYGGIVTLLTAEREVGIRSVVDMAGAAESWSSSPYLRDRLELAVSRARVPIFFMQSENDWNTEPSLRLSEVARDNNRPNQMRIFPRYGETHQDGHGKFCNHAMDVWGGEVLMYLANTMQIPATALQPPPGPPPPPPPGAAAPPAKAPAPPAAPGSEI